MILSFSLTEAEFLSGKKTVTRRFYSPRQIELWQKMWDTERLVHSAWNKNPRTKGAMKIGQFRLTCRPYLEQLSDMPTKDLIEEGDMVHSIQEFCELVNKAPSDVALVIRFEKID